MSLLEVVNQEGAIARLERARRTDRVAHGYIFSGPEGVGKFTLARQWAKLQLCDTPVKRPWPDGPGGDLAEVLDCCDTCKQCRLVESGTHPDLQVVNRELVKMLKGPKRSGVIMPIDLVREFIIDQAGSRPNHGQARVFLVDQAESMNIEAQNALLKTLEEPPAQTFLVLVSSRPERFLPTIRSRSHDVVFKALGVEVIRARLTAAGVTPVEAGYWAGFSQGRLGVALRLARLGQYERKRALVEWLGRLGWGDVLEMAQWLQAAAAAFGEALSEVCEGVSGADATRQGQLHWLEELMYTFREALQVGSRTASPSGLDQGPELEQIARRWGPEACARAVRETSRGWGLFEANVNAALVFESLVVKYLRLASEAA